MSEGLVIIAVGLGASAGLTFAAVRGWLSETTLVGWVGFFAGAGLVWVLSTGDRHAASRWRGEGQSAVVLCDRLPECAGQLQEERSARERSEQELAD